MTLFCHNAFKIKLQHVLIVLICHSLNVKLKKSSTSDILSLNEYRNITLAIQ